MHAHHAIHIPRRIIVTSALVAVLATLAIVLLASMGSGSTVASQCDALRAQANAAAQNYVQSMQGDVSPVPLAKATLDANAAQAGLSC